MFLSSKDFQEQMPHIPFHPKRVLQDIDDNKRARQSDLIDNSLCNTLVAKTKKQKAVKEKIIDTAKKERREYDSRPLK